jgi:hypothetical protein
MSNWTIPWSWSRVGSTTCTLASQPSRAATGLVGFRVAGVSQVFRRFPLGSPWLLSLPLFLPLFPLSSLLSCTTATGLSLLCFISITRVRSLRSLHSFFVPPFCSFTRSVQLSTRSLLILCHSLQPRYCLSIARWTTSVISSTLHLRPSSTPRNPLQRPDYPDITLKSDQRVLSITV